VPSEVRDELGQLGRQRRIRRVVMAVGRAVLVAILLLMVAQGVWGVIWVASGS